MLPAEKNLKKLGVIPVIAIGLTISLMIIFGLGEDHPCFPPVTLLIINAVFLSGIGSFIAAISSKSYLKDGSMSLLLLGMSSAGLGFAALAAGFANFFSMNVNLTIFNIGAVLAGAGQLVSAILAQVGSWPTEESTRKRNLFLGYSSILGFLTVVSVLAFLGKTPVFFINQPTLTRQWVVGASILFFAISAALYGERYFWTKSSAIYWYSLGLTVFAIALVGVEMFQTANAALNWTARFAMSIASAYFLISVLSVRKSANFVPTQSEGLSQGWIDAFSNDRHQLDVLFGKISQAVSYGRIVCDSKGKAVDFILLEVNGKFTELMGIKRQEAIGKRATTTFPSDSQHLSDYINILGEVALTQKPARFESYIKPSDKWLSVFVYSPRKGYFVTLLEDVTEHKKAHEALEKSQTDLQMKNKQLLEAQAELVKSERLAAIGEMAAMVGHDLRNPLTGIKNAAYMLGKKQGARLDETSKEMLGIIDRSVFHANKIVSDLLDYSREIRLDLAEYSPRPLINYALLSINKPNNIRVVDLTENEPKIWVDSNRIERVFTNLIRNAFDAMPNGGVLEIKTRLNGDSIEFVFADNGIGMSEETIEKIFKPLFTTKATGMGLGLAICKRIVEGHGGKLTVSSKLGAGSSFTVELPLNPKRQENKIKLEFLPPSASLINGVTTPTAKSNPTKG